MNEKESEKFKSILDSAVSLENKNMEIDLYSENIEGDPLILVAVLDDNISTLTKQVLDVIEKAAIDFDLWFVGVETYLSTPKIYRIYREQNTHRTTI